MIPIIKKLLLNNIILGLTSLSLMGQIKLEGEFDISQI